jgi:hypothetical protein
VQLEAQAILPVEALLVLEVKAHVRPQSRQLRLCKTNFVSTYTFPFVCKSVMTNCSR